MTDKSLVKKITKASYCLILGALLVAFCFNYWQAASQSKANHQKRLIQAISLLSKSLEDPIWSMDNSTIILIGDAFMANTDVAQLTVSSTDSDQPLFHRSYPDKLNVKFAEQNIMFNDLLIGHVKIGISSEAHKSSLRTLLVQSLILFSSLVFILALVIRYFLLKHLGSPLLKFGEWTDRVANGEYGETPPHVNLDELKTLAHKFVNMAEKVKSRELVLQNSERKFRGLFENSEVSIWNEDLSGVVNGLAELRDNGVNNLRTYLNDHPQKAKDLAAMIKIIEVNDATLKLFSAKDQEDIIRNIHNTFTPNSFHVFIDELCAIWDKKSFFRAETTFLALDGTKIEAIISFHIPDTIDDYSSLPVNIIDITDLKRAETELVKYRDQLQQLVDSQTQQLKEAQSKLLQKERLETLGRLTATVSHELRNPLGTIRNAVYAIGDELDDNLPEPLIRLMSLADRSIVRCVKIIEDLLDHTRVKELVVTETNLSQWIHDQIAEYEFPEGVDHEVDLGCGPPVFIDQEKLRQVLVNLITNASDALLDEKSNGSRIKISTQFFEEDYVIRVQDDGIGMSEDILAEVFEPLFSTKGFGIGLGMVIVKNIVEQHHGTIEITSSLGSGTTVALSLPICSTEMS